MKRKIMAAVLFTNPILAMAEWREIGTWQGASYKLKTETLMTVKGRHRALLQTKSLDGTHDSLQLLSVPSISCRTKQGQIQVSNVDGSEPSNYHFAISDKSKESNLAEQLCKLANANN